MPPEVPYAELDAALPIVMLPTRLETRYFDVDPATVELRVRIFPSVAHVTTTRFGVDPAERDETIAYWRTRRASGDDSAATNAAWRRMVQLFGDPRAQYLRRILTPTGAGAALVFPDVPLNPVSDGGSTLTSEAIALPTRFFVAGYEGDARRFLIAGQESPRERRRRPARRWERGDLAVGLRRGGGDRSRRADTRHARAGAALDSPPGFRSPRRRRRRGQPGGARDPARPALARGRRRDAARGNADEPHAARARAACRRRPPERRPRRGQTARDSPPRSGWMPRRSRRSRGPRSRPILSSRPCTPRSGRPRSATS